MMCSSITTIYSPLHSLGHSLLHLAAAVVAVSIFGDQDPVVFSSFKKCVCFVVDSFTVVAHHNFDSQVSVAQKFPQSSLIIMEILFASFAERTCCVRPVVIWVHY